MPSQSTRRASAIPSVTRRVACGVVDRLEVQCTHENQGGHPDLREPVERGRVELALLDVVPSGRWLERPPLHLSDQVAEGRVDETGVALGTVEPPGQFRLDGTVQVVTGQRGALRRDERTQVRRDLGDE